MRSLRLVSRSADPVQYFYVPNSQVNGKKTRVPAPRLLGLDVSPMSIIKNTVTAVALGFTPWPRNFHMPPQAPPKPKQTKKITTITKILLKFSVLQI